MLRRIAEREENAEEKLNRLKRNLNLELESMRIQFEEWTKDSFSRQQTIHQLNKGFLYCNESFTSDSCLSSPVEVSSSSNVSSPLSVATISPPSKEKSSQHHSSYSSHSKDKGESEDKSKSSGKNSRRSSLSENSNNSSGTERKERMYKRLFSRDSNSQSARNSIAFSFRGSSGSTSSESEGEIRSHPIDPRVKILLEVFDSEFSEMSLFEFLSEPPSELSWSQLLKKMKEEIDSHSREKLEQYVKEKGIGNSQISEEKKKRIFKVMGWDEKRLIPGETDKKMKKKRKELSKGYLGKRAKTGTLTPEDIEFLFITSHSNDEALVKCALIALAEGSWPNEMFPGLRVRVLSENLLEPISTLAESGEVIIHNEIQPEHVEMLGMIAEGASGKVFKAKYKGKDVAVKRFDVTHISFSLEDFMHEIAMTSLIQNDNLCTFYGAGTNLPSPFIVCELMSKGTLSEFLTSCIEFMDLQGRLNFCISICKGMTYLHSLSVIHRDLKPHNIMINHNLNCKIIDFGTSRVIDNAMSGGLGTPAWMAPEVLQSDSYSEKADVYSFGIVMWEMWVAKEPFSDLQIFAIPGVVIEGKRPPIPDDIHPEYSRIMQKCWDQMPEKRPPFKDLVLQFEWMSKNFKEDSLTPNEGAGPPPIP
eukprot:TRINITY_DN6926_c0_g1_i1.p1 TRINITY_DN6926_c0_g1~~TRINITY_DN6926_c0_g1_i1.p1  ORF type:complete len:704 (-),score=261.21 TRINITY_DN6926_c0_g1_i1:113-2050(-)